MKNNILSSLLAAQEITWQLKSQLIITGGEQPTAVALKTLAEKVVPLFENNRTVITPEDNSIESLAQHYIRYYPVLKPFIAQLLPSLQFPKVTQIFTRRNIQLGQHLFVRNTDDSLSSSAPGEQMECINQDLWTWSLDAKTKLEKKLFILVEDNVNRGQQYIKDSDYTKGRSQIIIPSTSYGNPIPEDILHLNKIYEVQATVERIKRKGKTLSDQELIQALNRIAHYFQTKAESSLFASTFKNFCHFNESFLLKPLEGCTPREYAEQCVIVNPALFPFFFQLYPDLVSLQDKLTCLKNVDDLARLEEELTALFQFFSKLPQRQHQSIARRILQETFDPLIALIEKVFADSSEKQSLAYRILVQKCDLLPELKDHFFYFSGENELLAIEVAKALAVSACRVDSIAYHIERFPIKCEKARIEIAKISAARDEGVTALNIKKFAITDKGALEEIAEISEAHSRHGISEHIPNFNLQNKPLLIKLAKSAAAKNGFILGSPIKNYNIDDKDTLFDIFLIALKNALLPGDFLDVYGFSPSDYPRLIKSTCALFSESYQWENLPSSLGEQILQMQSPEEQTKTIKCLFQFLNACGGWRKLSLMELNCLMKYQFIDPLKGYCQHIGKPVIGMLFLNGFGGPHLEADSVKGYDFTQETYSELIDELNTMLDTLYGWGNIPSLLGAEILKIKNQDHQKTTFCGFVHFLGTCANKKYSFDQMQFLMDNHFSQQFLHYRDLTMGRHLIKAIFSLVESEMGKNYIERAFSTVKTKTPKSQLTGIPNHAALPLLLLSLLYSQGISKDVCDLHLKEVCSSAYKEGKYLRIYINFLNTILQTEKLELADKEFLLYKIFHEYLPCAEMGSFQIDASILNGTDVEDLKIEEKEGFLVNIFTDHLWATAFQDPQLIPLIPCLRTILAIDDLGNLSILKKENLEKTTFNDTLQGAFEKIVPIKPMANFAELYIKHFSNARIPNYITHYAAKLAQAQSDEEAKTLLKFLAVCVEAFLDGTFLQKRYDLNASKHLQVVFGERPSLLETWKKGEKADLAQFLTACDPNQQEIDFHKIFHQQLIRDDHLKEVWIPTLKNYLTNSLSYADALESLELAMKELDVDTADFHELALQSKCIQLTNLRLPLKDKQALLKEIAAHLTKVDHSDVFRNDIKALREGLQKQFELEESYEGYQIVDTDDFEDLCLCGTEAGGSCQSIDGGVNLNKCLMGYILDGKNRLLAIKDREGKIVARHIFRILLVDNEPVLFLEMLYPYIIQPKLKEALHHFAQKRAEKLGLPLFSRVVKEGDSCGKTLLSLGSMAPFEYSDAAWGVTDGTYQIVKVQCLWTPPSQTIKT